MNIFRSLIGKVWQDPNAAEVVKISSGQLYLVRPGNIRTSRECIYNEAMATIRRVPSMEHNFQLVITRVYEDGDQELLEDEDETDEERVFLISEELEFRTGVTDGEPNFLWRDLDGDIDEFYEFVASGTNAPTCAFFETCMYQAMFERKYKRRGDTAQDGELNEFIWSPPAPKSKPQPRKKASKQSASSDLASTMESLSVSEPITPTRNSAKGKTTSTPEKTTPKAAAAATPVRETPLKKLVATPKKSSPLSSLPVVIAHEAELYMWDAENEDFHNQGVVTAQIFKQARFEYWLVASNDEGHLLAHRITEDMNQRFSNKMFSLTWNHVGDDGTPYSWLVRFPTQKAYEEMLQTFTACLWETLHQADWGKAKTDEQNYVLSASEDVEMLDVENEEDDESEVFSELDPDEEASESEDEGEEDQDDVPPVLPNGERNSQLTVGYKGDRSYVLRGSNVGVFNHSRDHSGVKYFATISKIATPKGKEFKPKQVMLHEQDTKMILMNPMDPHSLYSMDIERGKVVEEWKVHDNVPVEHIAPDNKFAPTTHEQTLVGASSNALFRIDPRVSGTKMVESQFKQYVAKNKFSGVATTASGKLAVASEKGDIRLFDTIGKNAKTALPPLGDPILGIDTTADGRWIVATTKTYLLLIDTLIGEGRYAGSLGFDRSFPANAKPMPRRLQLKSEHVAFMKDNVSFTPARFNQGEGQEENAIVTSTGPFVIAWDFAKVKKGKSDNYEIKKYEDHVVQDNFKFGDDKEIIVALQNNVLAINKKNLRKPTRESLAPQLHSRSNIVNSPF